MSLTRLASTIRRLGGGPVTVTRRAAPTTDGHGRALQGATSTHSITANVQPATGRDLLRLPEGQRTREHIAIWTDGDLRTANEHAGTPADVVTWKGRTYEVQLIEPWSDLGGYVKAVAAKVEA